jgi:hypothetical protein
MYFHPWCLYELRKILVTVVGLYTALYVYILSVKFVLLSKQQNYRTEVFEYIAFSIKNIRATQTLYILSLTVFNLSQFRHDQNIFSIIQLHINLFYKITSTDNFSPETIYNYTSNIRNILMARIVLMKQ